ncbi:hypothetical protein SAMN05216284_10412 [Micromonospora sediminimaris]|uniref:Uncharacterized protein n=1 Tax=Micromonospora sediminimaris TaxID=547162 RepID=A0A9W5ULU9_9ACTN|nr:hypothetical protein Vse01_07820 [Micromonospora sediminimaris]SFC34254.1 hypothetical protein SAMN05216284_10412 [Micromonospora sediminimaris]
MSAAYQGADPADGDVAGTGKDDIANRPLGPNRTAGRQSARHPVVGQRSTADSHFWWRWGYEAAEAGPVPTIGEELSGGPGPMP